MCYDSVYFHLDDAYAEGWRDDLGTTATCRPPCQIDGGMCTSPN